MSISNKVYFDKATTWSQNEENTEIFMVRTSPDSQFIASCFSNGIVHLSSSSTGRISYSLTQSEAQYPATSVRFHPKENRFLYTVSADGKIKEWNIKNPNDSTWSHNETDNQIYSLEITPSGDKFITGGKDCKLRVYDNLSKSIITELGRNEFDLESTRGHCNRIYSIISNPQNPEIIYSAGWDDTVQIWDLRTSSPVRALFGPHVSADSLDIHSNILLAGSWRTHSQFLLWDTRTFSQLRAFPWAIGTDDIQCRVYACKFTPDGNFIIAGGSGVNELKIFSLINYQSVEDPLLLPGPAFSFCYYKTGHDDQIAVGTKTDDIISHKIQFIM